jgi:hypothetical protein
MARVCGFVWAYCAASGRDWRFEIGDLEKIKNKARAAHGVRAPRANEIHSVAPGFGF